MQLSHTEYESRKKRVAWWQSDVLKWLVIGALSLFTCYLIVLMYSQGEYLFAIVTLILVSLGLYVFANRRAYAWRYVYPGVAGMGLFVLFPLICTIAIAFTNYSSTNQLTFERAQSVLMDRQFQTGKTFAFGLYPSDDQWRLQLTNPDDNTVLISEPFSFDTVGEHKLKVTPASAEQTGERASLRIITQNRQALSSLVATLPDGGELRMSSLRQFSGTSPLYKLADDGQELINKQTGVVYRPNTDIGFYQAVNADGQWENENSAPALPSPLAGKTSCECCTMKVSRNPLSLFSSGPSCFLLSVSSSRLPLA